MQPKGRGACTRLKASVTASETEKKSLFLDQFLVLSGFSFLLDQSENITKDSGISLLKTA